MKAELQRCIDFHETERLRFKPFDTEQEAFHRGAVVAYSRAQRLIEKLSLPDAPQLTDLKDIFDSIACLCAEGVEFVSRTELATAVLKEATTGYAMCKADAPQLTTICPICKEDAPVLHCELCGHNWNPPHFDGFSLSCIKHPEEAMVCRSCEKEAEEPWICDVCAEEFGNEVDLLAHQFNSNG